MKQNSIALIESGKRNLSSQAILGICREFNVNEEWLRTGQGEMFTDSARDNFIRDFTRAYNELTLEEKSGVQKLFYLLGHKKRPG